MRGPAVIRVAVWLPLLVVASTACEKVLGIHTLDELPVGAGGAAAQASGSGTMATSGAGGATASSAASSGATGATATSGTTSTGTGGVVCTHYVFLTNNTYAGDFNKADPNGADALCTAEAKAGSLTGTWKAVISDATTPANKRITVTGNVCLADDGIKKPSTTLVSDVNAWWLGPHKLPIDHTAGGTKPDDGVYPYVWTGTKFDGSASGVDCSSWKITTPPAAGTYGYHDKTADYWLDSKGQIDGCQNNRRLYCISQ